MKRDSSVNEHLAARGLAEPPPTPMLERDAVYLSPLGRRCMVRSISNGETWAALVYLVDGQRPEGWRYWREGFALSVDNWHLLRRVG